MEGGLKSTSSKRRKTVLAVALLATNLLRLSFLPLVVLVLLARLRGAFAACISVADSGSCGRPLLAKLQVRSPSLAQMQSRLVTSFQHSLALPHALTKKKKYVHISNRKRLIKEFLITYKGFNFIIYVKTLRPMPLGQFS